MKSVFALLLVVVLAGCATPYQPFSNRWQQEGGYVEKQMAPDLFLVTFQGNEHSSREMVKDLTFLRSSEVCAQHGFSYFSIEEDASGAHGTGVFYSPFRTLRIRCYSESPAGAKTFQALDEIQTLKQKYHLN